MNRIKFLLPVLLFPMLALAQAQPRVISLWEKGAPGFEVLLCYRVKQRFWILIMPVQKLKERKNLNWQQWVGM